MSFGGLAMGLVAIGGLGLGVVGIGGLGAGVYAVGGMAVGWQAAGGGAFAWDAAVGGGAVARHMAAGGAAIARDYAVGGGAYARHANDEQARAALSECPFIRRALAWMGRPGSRSGRHRHRAGKARDRRPCRHRVVSSSTMA